MQVIKETVQAWGRLKPETELVYISLPLHEGAERKRILQRAEECLLNISTMRTPKAPFTQGSLGGLLSLDKANQRIAGLTFAVLWYLCGPMFFSVLHENALKFL